ncbi:MAG TPA: hypothetical protein VKB86_08645 [Pyrinomonadaceae bacterium]|nr:hypothetical protein [Pyrinomonadaceae bacterium]
MNYFNYFTEIEDTFIRRRGKHLLLSPMDWALIESWKEMGVPLHVALRGIERAFDSFEAKPRRRSVKSLLYCQEEVEAQFAEWQESQVGAAEQKNGERPLQEQTDDSHLPFSRAAILEHMERVRGVLLQVCDERKKRRRDDLCDALSRAASRLNELEEDFKRTARPDAERLEDALTSLEKMLDEALLTSLATRELEAARAEAEEQLQPYRSRMERAVFDQTLENLLLKRLRDAHGLPRLSLFYL